MREPNRKEVMDSLSVHFVVKDILELLKDKDPVDAFHDISLAYTIIKAEMEKALNY
jgi:Holliday junction resolvasome RuvABC endonuclease subunit